MVKRLSALLITLVLWWGNPPFSYAESCKENVEQEMTKLIKLRTEVIKKGIYYASIAEMKQNKEMYANAVTCARLSDSLLRRILTLQRMYYSCKN